MQARAALTTFLAMTCVALMPVTALADTADPGHPTPGGPPPPSEPPVDGPVNLDALAATIAPDGGEPGGVRVSFDRTSRTVTGEKPAAATQFVFLFDKSLRVHPKKFPVCERKNLPDNCFPASIVGTGRATFYPQGSADVVVYNTRYPNGSYGVLITVPAVGTVLENTFEKVTDHYRGRYRWASDELLPSALPPAERGATTRFEVSFGATMKDARGRSHSYLTARGQGDRKNRALTFGLWSRFVTGQVLLLEDQAQP